MNEDVERGVGPFVVRLHPPVAGTPVRVDTIDAGTAGLTFSVRDRGYQVMYVSAELLNEVELIERIRSTEVR